ncbi:MAG: type III pantothenate kinase [Bacteroidota bacterium]
MITLAIDIGNTRAKAAVFNGHELVHEQVLQPGDIKTMIGSYRPQHAILSAVGPFADETADAIKNQQVPLLTLTHRTAFPFQINYDTPETLGMDRVAGVAAAQFLYPGTHCLVVDAGTCITYDFITAGAVYTGGAISPGLSMRVRAMHEFTQKLPQPGLAAPVERSGRRGG